MECAGEVVAVGEAVEGFRIGDAVLAIAPGTFSTFVTTRDFLATHKPAGLSFEDAATVPVAFLTARFALQNVAGIKSGDRVLIHAGAGGVGLAAVQLCQRAGAEIFATAGSDVKRDFLRSLGIQHVMSSRTLDFVAEIVERTGGRGVDIVLNSLTGEFIPASFSVLRQNSRFLEIGRAEIWDTVRIAGVHPTAAYDVIELETIIREQPALIREMFAGVMREIRQGELKPLPLRAFPLAEAEHAFRYMAQARHIGKIVVTLPAAIRSEGAYLITGGFGALGLAVAGRMVERGARCLILMGRSLPSDDAANTLREWESFGVRVKVIAADVSRAEDVKRVLAEAAADFPPLLGVVHAAGVLDDGVLQQQTWDRFEHILAPKMAGAWNLHCLTRHMELDFFVMFSSAASLFGSAGQGNYVAANAFLDALAHHRRANNLCALSINWGVWSEAGLAADRNAGQRLARRGLQPLEPTQGLDAFERLLGSPEAQVAVLPIRWARFLAQFPAGSVPPLFREMAEAKKHSADSTATSELLQRLKEAPPDECRGIIAAQIREHTLKVLGLPASSNLDPRQPLHELGLDSLMAVELRNAIARTVGSSLPASLLFDYPTVETIAAYLSREVLRLESAAESAPTAGGSDNRTRLLDQLEQIDEEEAEALLAEKLLAFGAGEIKK